MVRRWHLDNPDVAVGILLRTEVVRRDMPEARAEVMRYVREATRIGMIVGLDLAQPANARNDAGGGIANVADLPRGPGAVHRGHAGRHGADHRRRPDPLPDHPAAQREARRRELVKRRWGRAAPPAGR